MGDMTMPVESKCPVLDIRKKMLFVQLGDLHIRIYFGFRDNHVVPLLVEKSIIETVVKRIFPKERRLVHIRCHPVASI